MGEGKSMAVPTKKVAVTFKLKNGTTITYQDVEFFSNSLILLFNGDKSNIQINESEIETINILNKNYFIKNIDTTENEAILVKLEFG